MIPALPIIFGGFMDYVDISNLPYCEWKALSKYQEGIRGIWTGMRARCLVPTSGSYSRYGGRGIGVSKEWLDYETWYNEFGRFRPSLKHTMDRIDNDGDYCLENCRWATNTQQTRNTRRQKKIAQIIEQESLGEYNTNGAAIVALAKELNINAGTLQRRIGRYDPEKHGDDYRAYLHAKSVKIKTHAGTAHTINGIEFKSKAAAAKHFGIPKGTWTARMSKQGMTFEEAMLAKPEEQKAKQLTKKKETLAANTKIEFDGKVFNSIDALCAEYNLTKDQYQGRKKAYNPAKHGDYVTYMLHTELLGYTVEVAGMKFVSKARAYTHFGITQRAVKLRMEKGLTFEEALTLPKTTRDKLPRR